MQTGDEIQETGDITLRNDPDGVVTVSVSGPPRPEEEEAGAIVHTDPDARGSHTRPANAVASRRNYMRMATLAAIGMGGAGMVIGNNPKEQKYEGELHPPTNRRPTPKPTHHRDRVEDKKRRIAKRKRLEK